ncbi:hypothetical protein GCM10022240_19680 [Microbacterium kribbense]|uniref:FHA domain-containing protein n=1 Tax=Microbacterium kribbense TaxID=433645 RepID=A0ABP7GKJ2_9MICO
MADKYTPTTTHAAWGAGHPRLLVSGNDEHFEAPLDQDLVRIGSAEDVHVRLADLIALHAEVVHDPNDEYVLVLHGPAQTSARHVPLESLDGRPGEILRSGARFVLGDWAFVFARDEFADHGRPFGGRQGGEGSHERTQPDRPDYTGTHPITIVPQAAQRTAR